MAKWKSPVLANWKSPPCAGCSGGQGRSSSALAGLEHAVGLAVGDDGSGVVQEPVEHVCFVKIFGPTCRRECWFHLTGQLARRRVFLLVRSR